MRFLKNFIIVILCFSFLGTNAYAASPPVQPATGPGGQEYSHASVMKFEFGEGGQRYWIFEPSSPIPESAPVIIFMHGWGAINPKAYGAWIGHLVLRGNIVIYPLYQDKLRSPVTGFLPNTISAIKDALLELQQPGHVHPLLNKCAVVGHSMGGLIAADLAAIAKEQELPQPLAVMSVAPGGTEAKNQGRAYHLKDLSLIPAGTLLLTVAGDADRLAKDIDAKRIFKESTSVYAADKNYIIVRSDSHGTPALKANHFAPVAKDEQFDSGESLDQDQEGMGNEMGIRGRIRERLRRRMQERMNSKEHSFALDYYGYWKLFDALCDAAFYDKNREYALGNTPQQRFMGKWSDGVPVKELIVTKAPGS